MLVLPPDEQARAAILDFHLRDRPQRGVDLKRLARRTSLFSGADLAQLCDTAAEYAMEDSVRSGRIRPIEARDFDRALSGVNPSTLAWFDVARNHAYFANAGGMYDELLKYMSVYKLG